MRVVFILAAVAAITLANTFNNSAKNVVRNEDDLICPLPFSFYYGYCVHTTDPKEVSYGEALATCDLLGGFAPSFHNEADQDLWISYAHTFSGSHQHFWLDASCPLAGLPYVWRDGTPTNYFGHYNELLKCTANTAFHLETSGFNKYTLPGAIAPAVCVYKAQPPVKSTPEPVKSTPTPTPEPTNAAAPNSSCNPSKIYLDIVFIVDTSADMTKDTVEKATATIKSTLNQLTFGTEYFQSNVAALAFADYVQVVRDFGSINSTDDVSSISFPYLAGSPTKLTGAIKQASSMIISNGRNFTRGVIVLLTNSFYQPDVSNIGNAANTFKESGGIFMSIDYSNGRGIWDLQSIASSGFYISVAPTDFQLDSYILDSFCDANSFCRDGLVPYNSRNDRGRDLPTGCYLVPEFPTVYNAAEAICESKNGFVATIHDDDKNFFMLSLFPPKERFWIGLTRNGTEFVWEDGINDNYSSWAVSNPLVGQDCTYAQQQTGFTSYWFSAPCSDSLQHSLTYACQLLPCDTENDCRF